jgi:hypothetical protein
VRVVNRDGSVNTVCGIANEKGINEEEGYVDEVLLDSPTKVIFDSLYDRLFVLDRGNKMIRYILMEEDPSFIRTFAGNEVENVLVEPYDMALDSLGQLFCCDAGIGAILRFDENGHISELTGVIDLP